MEMRMGVEGPFVWGMLENLCPGENGNFSGPNCGEISFFVKNQKRIPFLTTVERNPKRFVIAGVSNQQPDLCNMILSMTQKNSSFFLSVLVRKCVRGMWELWAEVRGAS
jgi:hypothetical protein